MPCFRFFADIFEQEHMNSFWYTMRAFYDGDGYAKLPLYFRFFDVAVSVPSDPLDNLPIASCFFQFDQVLVHENYTDSPLLTVCYNSWRPCEAVPSSAEAIVKEWIGLPGM